MAMSSDETLRPSAERVEPRDDDGEESTDGSESGRTDCWPRVGTARRYSPVVCGVYCFDKDVAEELSSSDDSDSPGEVQDALAVAETGLPSIRVRSFVYFVFCLGVQMFMSYDGGATPASLDTIQKDSGLELSETEIGLLGAFDKLGQTMLSVFWGRAMQLVPTKLLLVSALGANALFSLAFGLVVNKYAMFGAKFLQGATEALQGVWGTVWTLRNAPEAYRTQWMGLGAIAAGLGTGVGSAVAGFGTANGAPYSMAFILQASMLGLFWLTQLLMPSPLFNIRGDSAPPASAPVETSEAGSLLPTPLNEPPLLSRTLSRAMTTDQLTRSLSPLIFKPQCVTREFPPTIKEEDPTPSSSSSDVNAPVGNMKSQLLSLWNNKLYLRTMFCVAHVYFFCNGVQFIWFRTFVEGVWELNKNFVTSMFLVVSGVGSFAGVLLGPAFVDRSGGYADDTGKFTSLQLLQRAILLAVFASLVGIIAVAFRMANVAYASFFEIDKWLIQERPEHDKDDSFAYIRRPLEHIWLILCWLCMMLVYMALNGSIATLTAINCDSVPEGGRALATGTTVSVQNLLGYAGGAFLPGVAMDVFWYGYYLATGDDLSLGSQLGMGLIFIFSSTLSLLFWVWMATRAARQRLNQ